MTNISIALVSSLLMAMLNQCTPTTPPVTNPPPPRCGTQGQSCCVRDVGGTMPRQERYCNPGLGCGLDGICSAGPGGGTCGQPSGVCCNNNTCTSGDGEFVGCRVESHVCFACGGSGEPCCPDGQGLPLCVLETDECNRDSGTCRARAHFP